MIKNLSRMGIIKKLENMRETNLKIFMKIHAYTQHREKKKYLKKPKIYHNISTLKTFRFHVKYMYD